MLVVGAALAGSVTASVGMNLRLCQETQRAGGDGLA